MLQTAPVLIFFPPTTGSNAQPDAQPVRYDFTMGYFQQARVSTLSANVAVGHNLLNKSTTGSVDICPQDRNQRYTVH